jgi:hypothetical protein
LFGIPGKTSHPIYMHKGDGRLTTHDRHINLLHYFAFTIFSLAFASCSSLRQRTQGPRGGHTNLGQPIATVLPDGVPPGSVGCRVSRALTNVSCVSRSRRDSPCDVSCASRSSPGTHVMCSCVNTMQECQLDILVFCNMVFGLMD